MKFEVEFYKHGNKNPISDFILSLDEKLQLDTFALLRKLEENPFVLGSMSKKIKGVKNLFELRIKGQYIIVRLFYCYKRNRIIIVLHGFVKKSQKTPKKELDIAIKRKREIENE
ncbi:hypothetical protein BMS3Abin04_02531 [bacterium BMS3Abin04]|nr:hypothetical protein BMS3Abin04_02531 [bacterium BMS3Abin04]